jgi:hypothetical protein
VKNSNAISDTRAKWLEATKHASSLAREMFQEGCGYGDPDARRADEYKLQLAKDEAERLFREYHNCSQDYLQSEMLRLQNSQHIATWSSFFVALAVGFATITNIVLALLK